MADDIFPPGTVEWRPQGSPSLHSRRVTKALRDNLSLVREVRGFLDLTQEAAAEILNVSQAAVSKQERSGSLNIDTMRKLARAKGASIRLVMRAESGEELDLAL